jgi:hypothetical protein
MTITGRPVEEIDARFDSVIQVDGAFPTYVELAGTAELFGTRRPVRVGGTIDGHEFTATLMPSGKGSHWLPVRAELRKRVGKDAGDEVVVHLDRRFG